MIIPDINLRPELEPDIGSFGEPEARKIILEIFSKQIGREGLINLNENPNDNFIELDVDAVWDPFRKTGALVIDMYAEEMPVGILEMGNRRYIGTTIYSTRRSVPDRCPHEFGMTFFDWSEGSHLHTSKGGPGVKYLVNYIGMRRAIVEEMISQNSTLGLIVAN